RRDCEYWHEVVGHLPGQYPGRLCDGRVDVSSNALAVGLSVGLYDDFGSGRVGCPAVDDGTGAPLAGAQPIPVIVWLMRQGCLHTRADRDVRAPAFYLYGF